MNTLAEVVKELREKVKVRRVSLLNVLFARINSLRTLHPQVVSGGAWTPADFDHYGEDFFLDEIDMSKKSQQRQRERTATEIQMAKHHEEQRREVKLKAYQASQNPLWNKNNGLYDETVDKSTWIMPDWATAPHDLKQEYTFDSMYSSWSDFIRGKHPELLTPPMATVDKSNWVVPERDTITGNISKEFVEDKNYASISDWERFVHEKHPELLIAPSDYYYDDPVEEDTYEIELKPEESDFPEVLETAEEIVREYNRRNSAGELLTWVAFLTRYHPELRKNNQQNQRVKPVKKPMKLSPTYIRVLGKALVKATVPLPPPEEEKPVVGPKQIATLKHTNSTYGEAYSHLLLYAYLPMFDRKRIDEEWMKIFSPAAREDSYKLPYNRLSVIIWTYPQGMYGIGTKLLVTHNLKGHVLSPSGTVDQRIDRNSAYHRLATEDEILDFIVNLNEEQKTALMKSPTFEDLRDAVLAGDDESESPTASPASSQGSTTDVPF